MVAVHHSASIVAAASRPRFALDPVLYGANGGALLLWDMGNSFCRPFIKPSEWQRVRDLSGYTVPGQPIISGHEDGHARLATSGTNPVFNEDTNGVYFGGSKEGAMLESSVHPGQHIINSADQFFLFLFYITVPSLNDWPTGIATRPWLAFGEGTNDFVNGAALLAIGPYLSGGTTRQFRAHRAKGSAVNSADDLAITTDASDENRFAQLAFWRNANGQGFQLKTGARISTGTGAVSTKNTVSGANALTCKIGVPPALNVDGSDEGARKFTFHRLYVEDLAISGRDPQTVAGDDWQRQIDRGVFV